MGTKGAVAHARKMKDAAQVCDVVVADASPLYVCPRNLPLMNMEAAYSFAELRDYLRPQQLGSCCGRQNMRAPESLVAAAGASAAATTSRVAGSGGWSTEQQACNRSST